MEPIINIDQFVAEADDDTLTEVFFSDEITDEAWQAVHDEMTRRDLFVTEPEEG